MILDEIGHMQFVTMFFYGFKISTKLLYSIESLSLIKPFINRVEASSYVDFEFIVEHLNWDLKLDRDSTVHGWE